MTTIKPVFLSSPVRWLLLPGVIMSVGWGLRGFIGGGPLAAMIPGALVALAICFLLDETGCRSAQIAAFGAIGVGFGGQETYGQTMHFVSRLELDALAFGLAGVAIKGAAWGLVGGACIGTGLILRKEYRWRVVGSLGLLVAGTYVGWKFINQPKLLYFSDRLDRPRAELWAGLLVGGLCFLGGMKWAGLAKIPARFALAGAVGGGLGFPLGALFVYSGSVWSLATTSYPGWKLMEFTFGLCFGLALGLCAYLNRDHLTRSIVKESADLKTSPVFSIGLALLAIAFGWAALQLHLRFSFTVAGAVLLAAGLFSNALAWQVALTITVAAFTRDVTGFLIERHPAWSLLGWILLAVVPLAVAWWLAVRTAAEGSSVRFPMLLLLWTAMGAAYARTLLYEHITVAQTVVAVIFTLMAVVATLLVRRSLVRGSPLA